MQAAHTTVMMLLLLSNTIFWASRIHHLEIKLSLSVDKMHTYLLGYSASQSRNYGDDPQRHALHFPIKSHFCDSQDFYHRLWWGLFSNAGGKMRGKKSERTQNEVVLLITAFIPRGKRVRPHSAFCFKYIHASFSSRSSGCPLPILWLGVFPWEHTVASQFLCL